MDNPQVTDHYNARPLETRHSRKQSPIFQMRKFNNWLKSVLIYLHTRPGYSVLDLCCGKGGDLHKWSQAGAATYVACDTAQVSVQECANRYNGMGRAPFRPSLLVGDCFQVNVDDYIPRDIMFDVVSCQFAIHYAFESESRVRNLVKNVTDRLKPGGFFIGTTVDANVLVRKLRAVDDMAVSNSVYEVRLDPAFKEKRFPKNNPYGVRYNFSLDQSVEDCPEYLVHFPSFERLAAEYGLELVLLSNFHDFFVEFTKDEYPEYLNLLFSMNVLDETGSIEPNQWDAIYLYTAFAFKRKGEANPGLQKNQVRPTNIEPIGAHEIIMMR
ncbi:unnamed protein product [Agarophyton chilense]|eukprot:gb/GEZJ01004235.1/.p1 GENE.gb/GEZJ01004235.1/~~gb/GEZJ01004235.1/.p1  ORF type:complete len:326 (-),score=29.32 gb/GEZJ01004235.1/:1120-2097(-)